MRNRINHLFKEKRFKREFRREMRLLIIITLGFTIAFSWRQTIFDMSISLMRWITHIQSSSGLSILASILITLVSVVIIYFASHFLKGRERD